MREGLTIHASSLSTRARMGALAAMALASAACSSNPPPTASVDVNPETSTIAVGATEQLTATLRGTDGTIVTTATFAWMSSAANIATVSQTGLVTGVAAGTANITATSDTIPRTVSVTVTQGSTMPPTLVCRASTTSVLEHHANQCRDGRYQDVSITRATAATYAPDATFAAALAGQIFYAQPLYFPGGPGGKTLVIVASEQNIVTALDAANGSVVWTRALGTPVPMSSFACGNIDPVGSTSTGVIDANGRTLYVTAMTTPDAADAGTLSKKQMIYGLSLDDGTDRAGFPPIDVSAKVSFNGTAFDSSVQQQRGALALVNGNLYVPYGSFYGDCGDFRGWLVAIPTASPGSLSAWSTPVRGGGPWSSGGVASDGVSAFITTGNTYTTGSTWADGEAVLRFSPGSTLADSYAPANWLNLDQTEQDVGGSGPVLLDLAGATPSTLAVGLGKSGNIYLVDRNHLGGVGGPAVIAKVATNAIITAATAYTTALGTYVVFKGTSSSCPPGQSGDLTAVKLVPGNPPTVTTAWCATQGGLGSPIVTTTDGTAESVVWSLGAGTDEKLHGFNGDTGAVIYTSPALARSRSYTTPIVGGGRIFVATDGAIRAFVHP